MIFLDSNIWCYYFDRRLPEHECVKELVREILKSSEIACNTIVVIEVAHYLVRHFSQKDARKKIELFVNLNNLKVADFDRQSMSEALEYLLENAYPTGLGGRDASILASMKILGTNEIVSHDDIFKRLSNKLKIKITDPVQKHEPELRPQFIESLKASQKEKTVKANNFAAQNPK